MLLKDSKQSTGKPCYGENWEGLLQTEEIVNPVCLEEISLYTIHMKRQLGNEKCSGFHGGMS